MLPLQGLQTEGSPLGCLPLDEKLLAITVRCT